MFKTSLCVALMVFGGVAAARPPQVNYDALWHGGMPFDRFLSSVQSHEAQWKSRFANAAIDADALTRVRALKERRRLLIIAEDRCSDSAWALPYIAKLAAVAPERLELRIISRDAGAEVQEYRTPDGRVATPTVILLDESNRPLAGWVERPAALHAWVVANRASLSSEAVGAKIEKWYTDDAGRTTVREIVELLEKAPAGGK